MERLVTIGVGILILIGVVSPATASAPSLPPTYAPQSGPPGTVVDVSNITLCDAQQPPVVTGQIGFAVDQAGVHTPDSFTPPNAQITIPDVANGEYVIV